MKTIQNNKQYVINKIEKLKEKLKIDHEKQISRTASVGWSKGLSGRSKISYKTFSKTINLENEIIELEKKLNNYS